MAPKTAKNARAKAGLRRNSRLTAARRGKPAPKTSPKVKAAAPPPERLDIQVEPQ